MSDHSTVDDAAKIPAMPFRVYALEGRANTTDAALMDVREVAARLDERSQVHGETLATHTEQIKQLTTATSTLTTTVSKVMWALVGFAMTVAGSTAVAVLTHSLS